jgi:hypothetical protein
MNKEVAFNLQEGKKGFNAVVVKLSWRNDNR